MQRRTFLASLVRSSLAVTVLLAKSSSAQTTSRTGRLDLRVFDKKSSKAMPARFHLQLEGGLPWTPLARPSGHHHGDALPPLLTGHDFQPMIAPQSTSVLSTHLSSGQVVLELPAGRHRLHVSRGFEYKPIQLDVTIRHNRTTRHQLALEQWVDMPAQGYFSGDIHQHFTRSSPQAVEAALGLIDFIEVVQFMTFFGQTFWYRLLGSGLKVAGVGGTDFPFGIWLAPWYPSFGQERTYVKVNGDFGANTWFDGVRRGEVFASNGPMLWFKVEGQPSGATLHLDGSGKVRIEATARCVYPLEVMEILINGRVAEEVHPATPSRELIHLNREFSIDQSSWIAARARGTVEKETFGGARQWPLFAHSGPVFALLAGQPVRIESDLEFLLDYTHRFREFVVNNGVFDAPEHKQIFLANIDEAVTTYRQRLQGR